MTEEQYQIIDEAGPRTNFTMVPNIVDDMMLSPHAFRLYIHFRRVAGENRLCYQSVKTLAMICKMSTGMVSQAKKELVEAKLIRSTVKVGPNGNYCEVAIIDIWQRNSEGGVHNMGKGVHIMGDPSPQYETNNIKNNIGTQDKKAKLTETDYENVNKQVLDIIGLSDKAKKNTQTLLPEQFQEQAKWFMQATGLSYVPKFRSLWIEGFEEWNNLGAIEEDVKKAVDKLQSAGFSIVSPGSLTKTLNGIVANRKKDSGSYNPWR